AAVVINPGDLPAVEPLLADSVALLSCSTWRRTIRWLWNNCSPTGRAAAVINPGDSLAVAPLLAGADALLSQSTRGRLAGYRERMLSPRGVVQTSACACVAVLT